VRRSSRPTGGIMTTTDYLLATDVWRLRARRKAAEVSDGDEESFFLDTLAEYRWGRDAAGLAATTLDRLTKPVLEITSSPSGTPAAEWITRSSSVTGVGDLPGTAVHQGRQQRHGHLVAVVAQVRRGLHRRPGPPGAIPLGAMSANSSREYRRGPAKPSAHPLAPCCAVSKAGDAGRSAILAGRARGALHFGHGRGASPWWSSIRVI